MDVSRLNTYYNVGSTTEVTKYANGASPYGAMDMAGNVSEWVEDDFKPYPGSAAPAHLFQGRVAVATEQMNEQTKIVDFAPIEGSYKVVRGGSWKSDPFSTTTYHRNYSLPNRASDFFGFRAAADIEGPGK
jgi:iron(II)-dependent oxidoreductase